MIQGKSNYTRSRSCFVRAALKGWLEPRTTFTTCPGVGELPVLRQSSGSVLDSRWELASLPQWF